MGSQGWGPMEPRVGPHGAQGGAPWSPGWDQGPGPLGTHGPQGTHGPLGTHGPQGTRGPRGPRAPGYLFIFFYVFFYLFSCIVMHFFIKNPIINIKKMSKNIPDIKKTFSKHFLNTLCHQKWAGGF